MIFKNLLKSTKKIQTRILNLGLVTIIGFSGLTIAMPLALISQAAAASSLAPAPAPCAVSGTPFITINQPITNDPDSGNYGNWATDAFTEHVTVWIGTDSATYCANAYTTNGTFVTTGPLSPQNGLTLPSGITGTFTGGENYVLPLTLSSNYQVSSPQVINLPSSSTAGFSSWVSQVFPSVPSGSGSNYVDTYSLTYLASNGSTWTDADPASGGESGDIMPVFDVTSGEGYSTIQDAINNALPNSIINVAPGNYNIGDLAINNPVYLLGPNANINPNISTRNAEATITGRIIDYAGNTEIKGFTVTNPNWNGATIEGIHVYNNSNVPISSITLQNNIFTNINNSATNGSYGIMVQGVTNNVSVLNNKFDNIDSAGWAHALEVTPTANSSIVPQNTIITGNVFSNIVSTQSDAYAFSVDSARHNNSVIYADASQVTFSNNSVYGKVRNLDPGHELNAINNYWGSATPDFNSILSSGINYSPWFTNSLLTTLSDAKVLPDSSGNATVNNTTPQVTVTSSTQPVDITVASGTVDATIDYSSLGISNNNTVVVPQTTVNTAGGDISIPASTTITASGSWNGVINVPTIEANSSVSIGSNKTVSSVIEVGSNSVSLTFSNAVRLLIPGQSGKSVGFVRNGVFTPISTPCRYDTQTAGNALAAGGDCYFDNGTDMVVWTKHFTTFVTYVQAATRPVIQKTYTVLAGDTLSGIGTSVGVDWHSIASLNGISAPYTIYPGQILDLPANASTAVTASPVITQSTSASAVLGESTTKTPPVAKATKNPVVASVATASLNKNWIKSNWFTIVAIIVLAGVVYYAYRAADKKTKKS